MKAEPRKDRFKQPHKAASAMDTAHHVVIDMSGSASLDVALAREEALTRFRDINWATYTRYEPIESRGGILYQ